MLFINLKANLGNNLFQYSFLRKVAESHNQNYYLSGDFSQITKYFDSDFRVIQSIFKLLICKVFRQKITVIKPKRKSSGEGIFREDMLSISDLTLNSEEKYVLDGWFQYCDYTSPCYISYKKRYLNRVTEYLAASNITALDSYCCIHLRYRDYFTTDTGRANQYGWVLPINYYQNAAKILKSSADPLKFIVVSDDIDLARKTMSWLPENTHFSTLESPILDMILISLCKYKIITNSTFSWWGARLSFDGATILCPNYLIRSGKQVKISSETYPKNWMRIEFSSDHSPDEIAIYNEHLQNLDRKQSIKKKSITWRAFSKIQRLLGSISKRVFHLV